MTVNRPNRLFSRSMLFGLRLYLEHMWNIEVELNYIKKINPPYIILANHVNNWDPFLINMYLDEPISYVTSDEYFRNPILKKLLNYVGAIPKTKFKSDLSTVKKILSAKRDNRIIGIFPEGRRSWDGCTGKILYSTAKLIKLLKIPVVTTVIEGGHLSYPRWATNHRKGKILISYKLIMDADTVKKDSIDTIHKKIVAELKHDEYAMQKEQMNLYKGKNLAENLELYLFICPNCKTIGNMKSKGKSFFCQNCDYASTYTDTGFLQLQNNEYKHFNNPRDWNKWQIQYLKKLISNSFKDSSTSILFCDNGVNIHIGKKGQKLNKMGHGKLYLNSDRFYFLGDDRNKIAFDFQKIKGLNIQYNNKIEFYYGSRLYRFSFKDTNISAYKWTKGLEICIEHEKKSKKEGVV